MGKGTKIIVCLLIMVVIVLAAVGCYFIIKGKDNGAKDTRALDFNGKKYVVSYFENVNDEFAEEIIFFNEKEVDTVKFDRYEDYPKYDLKAYKFCQNYILVSIGYSTPGGDMVDFRIYNLDGKFIEEYNWTSAQGIYHIAMQKALTYEIKEDGLITYGLLGGASEKMDACKYKHTVKDNKAQTDVIEIYNYSEVEYSGKY